MYFSAEGRGVGDDVCFEIARHTATQKLNQKPIIMADDEATSPITYLINTLKV